MLQLLAPLTCSYDCLCLCVQLNDGDFKLLIVTDDSSVVLNQLRVNEQGTYRCSLQGRNGTVFYRLHFLLTGQSATLEYIPAGESNITAQFISHLLTVSTRKN